MQFADPGVTLCGVDPSRTRPGKRPGPKPRLSRELIIEAATRVDPLTIGSIAVELGASPGSLYRHVDSLRDITTGAAEWLFVSTPMPGDDLDWRSYLEVEASHRLELLGSHPGLFADAAAHLTEVAADRLTRLVRALETKGFTTADAVLALDTVIDLVHDGARQALAITAAEPPPGYPEDIRAVLGEVLADPWKHVWHKLQIVLDGIAATGRRHPAAGLDDPGRG